MYTGTKGGLTLTMKAEGEVWFPRVGNLLTLSGYQTESAVDIACAAITVPGDAKAATPTGFNDYHNSHGPCPRGVTQENGEAARRAAD